MIMADGWVRSSKSMASHCLEAKPVDDVVLIREGSYTAIAVATSRGSWKEFVMAVKAGEFDFA